MWRRVFRRRRGNRSSRLRAGGRGRLRGGQRDRDVFDDDLFIPDLKDVDRMEGVLGIWTKYDINHARGERL